MQRRIVPGFLEMGADSQENPDGVGLRNQRSHDLSRGWKMMGEIGAAGQSAHSARYPDA